jgi:hypothetical protein
MFAGAFFLFLVVMIYAVRHSIKKSNEQREMKPSIIDARLRPPSPRIPEATNVAASNLGIRVPQQRIEWSKYDAPTVLRRRNTMLKPSDIPLDKTPKSVTSQRSPH